MEKELVLATLPPPLDPPQSRAQVWISRLRRWLVAGLIVLAPSFVTLWALLWLFNHVDRPFRGVLAAATGYDVPGAGVVMVVLLLLLTGAVASNIVIRSGLRWLEKSLEHIPLVRTLYSGVKQLTAPLADEHGTSFQKVVVIQYPSDHCYALGFLINPNAGRAPSGELLAAVLLPTNHLHLGNVVLCPHSRIHHADMSAEEALRFLVSMGAAQTHPIHLAPPLANPPPEPERA